MRITTYSVITCEKDRYSSRSPKHIDKILITALCRKIPHFDDTRLWCALVTSLGMLTRLKSLDLFSWSQERNFSTLENRDYRPPDNIVSGIIYHLLCRACYQSIVCLLHHVCGLHTRHMDAAKQRTVAYLGGRVQIFLLPDADNHNYIIFVHKNSL